LPENVKLPLREFTELPSQSIVAVPIESVRPLDEVWPLFGTKSGEPGSEEPAAPTPPAPGPIRAAPASPATTSQESGRARRDRRR